MGEQVDYYMLSHAHLGHVYTSPWRHGRTGIWLSEVNSKCKSVDRVSASFLSLASTAQPRQGRNHVFKVGGPIPWSRVLLPFYRKKIRQVYPVWWSRLHNHTLFIKNLCKTLIIITPAMMPVDTSPWLAAKAWHLHNFRHFRLLWNNFSGWNIFISTWNDRFTDRRQPTDHVTVVRCVGCQHIVFLVSLFHCIMLTRLQKQPEVNV